MDFIKEGLSHVIDKKWLTIAEPEFKGSNVKKFTENENGLLLVSEIFSKKERACFVVIFINRTRHTVCCCTTQGDRIEDRVWDYLCQLNDNGRFFVCCAYRYKCERYDEPFAVYLADFFTNGTDMVLDRVPSDREILQIYRINVNHEMLDQVQKKRREGLEPIPFLNYNNSTNEEYYKNLCDKKSHINDPRNIDPCYIYNEYRESRERGINLIDRYAKEDEGERNLRMQLEHNPNDKLKKTYDTVKHYRLRILKKVQQEAEHDRQVLARRASARNEPDIESTEEKHFREMSELFPNNKEYRHNHHKHRELRTSGIKLEDYNSSKDYRKLHEIEQKLKARMEANPTNHNYRDNYNQFRNLREDGLNPIQFYTRETPREREYRKTLEKDPNNDTICKKYKGKQEIQKIRREYWQDILNSL